MPVAPLARDVGLAWDSGPLLDHVAPDHPAWYAVPQASTTIRRRFWSSSSVRPKVGLEAVPAHGVSSIVRATAFGCS